ncbi:MAG TPA: hypothetical protein PLJ20_00280 [Candidatus Contendobacter sp.]|nr:hypothetical protein [Candidatus Contendobacter sp.]
MEWTEPVWNPVTSGTKVSPACQHGSAEVRALRRPAMGVPGDADGFALTRHGDRLDPPLDGEPAPRMGAGDPRSV